MSEHREAHQHDERTDRAEALAALRKALGLERLLGRARHGNRVTPLPRTRRREPAGTPRPTHAAA
jgi:hypothetical protein